MMCLCGPDCMDVHSGTFEFISGTDEYIECTDEFVTEKPSGGRVDTPDEAKARQRCIERQVREAGEQQAARSLELQQFEGRVKQNLRLKKSENQRIEEAKVHAARVLEMERVEREDEEKREQQEQLRATSSECSRLLR
uniref:Uncharacterized protein n=1 Tax=Noctiluca scintillans TaxID=2966 RepID=A0A7S1AEU2_NOCSC|mmetsp:Transcript_43436/g.114491  ORF Transcript_43436/g.114491 Transcript_43436/m.114491 type:complete len:138 (+) Transcript_43436:74-487(+)